MITDLKPCNKDKQRDTLFTLLHRTLTRIWKMKNTGSFGFIISLLLTTTWARKEVRKTVRTVTETGDDTIDVIVENTQETDM